MSNLGVFPLEPDTDVSDFRVLAGDANATPTVEGFGEFNLWSDSEIETYLRIAPLNIYRAIALAYTALAGQTAVQAKMVKDYDLTVDTTKRADKLRAMAEHFTNLANEHEVEGGTDFFISVGHREHQPDINFPPELSPWRLDDRLF